MSLGNLGRKSFDTISELSEEAQEQLPRLHLCEDVKEAQAGIEEALTPLVPCEHRESIARCQGVEAQRAEQVNAHWCQPWLPLGTHSVPIRGFVGCPEASLDSRV